jgi:hypothetical protein
MHRQTDRKNIRDTLCRLLGPADHTETSG